MTSIIDLLSPRYAPVQSCLLQYLDPSAIARLTMACKGFGCLWPTLMASAYDINRQLRNFFTDPKDFRSAQGESDALIYDHVGGDRLKFFARGDNRQVKSLVVHIQDDRTRPMVEYLEADGYALWQPYPEGSPAIEDELSFRKKRPGRMTYYVDIRHYQESPIQTLLQLEPTPEYLMCLSWNKAYALFPVETLVKQEFLLLSSVDGILEMILGRLKRRRRSKNPVQHTTGTTIAKEEKASPTRPQAVMVQVEDRDLSCYDVAKQGPHTMLRQLGDKYTFLLNLNTEGVKVPITPDAVLESTAFLLERHDQDFVSQYGDGTHPRFSIRSTELRHPILKHWYVVPSIDGEVHVRYRALGERIEALGERLDRLTFEEARKIPEGERPIEYQYNLLLNGELGSSDVKRMFTLPATWTFYDDEVLDEVRIAWERRDDVWVEQDGQDIEKTAHVAMVATGSD